MIISSDARLIARRHDKVVLRDKDRVIKVFSKDKPSEDVFNEALNLSRVSASDIRISTVLEVSRIEEGVNAGCWAIANRYVEGETMRAVLLRDPYSVHGCLERFVRLQMEVHEVALPTLNRQKDKLIRMVSSTKGILDAAHRCELHTRLDGMRVESRVCHGDYVPSNVIIGTDGQLYVCDWAHVTAGIPEVDVATTYLLLAMNYPDFARRYLDLYCRWAEMDRAIVEWWLPVVAGAELSRGKEAEREYLLRMSGV